MLANYRVQRKTYIVDTVFDRAILVSGRDKVTIARVPGKVHEINHKCRHRKITGQNQPPQPAGKPYSVRRVNNVPLVIGFCLVAAFVAIVFLVVLPSNDNGRKETKTKIVSAEGEAANVNAGAPIGFVPAR